MPFRGFGLAFQSSLYWQLDMRTVQFAWVIFGSALPGSQGHETPAQLHMQVLYLETASEPLKAPISVVGGQDAS